MLPATVVASPAASASAPASAVTVVLPLVPVIAITFWPTGRRRANSSTSPTSVAPAATASAIAGWSFATPGEIAIISAPSNVDATKGPVSSRTPGSASWSALAAGGAWRVSATRTRAP